MASTKHRSNVGGSKVVTFTGGTGAKGATIAGGPIMDTDSGLNKGFDEVIKSFVAQVSTGRHCLRPVSGIIRCQRPKQIESTYTG